MSDPLHNLRQVEIQERIAQAFTGTEWEGKIWLVGGCVRDRLLGLPIGSDIDLVVEGDALGAARHLHEIGMAKAEPAVYPRFGTAMVRVDGLNIELAMARRESYVHDSRKPKTQPVTVTEDLFRRDFTINTLLLNPWTGEIEDRLGQGLFDLKKRILRTPIAPDITFYDDPLRMLRAVRFRNRFEMQYSPDLAEAIPQSAYRLEIVSRERVQDELFKIISAPSAASGVRDLAELGLMEQIFPGIGAEVAERVAVLDDPLLRMAAVTAPYGAEKAWNALREMKFSADFARDVWLVLENEARIKPDLTAADLRRLVHDLRRLAEPTLSFALSRREWSADEAARIRGRWVEVSGEEGADSGFDCPLTGEELKNLLGLGEGPDVGRVKSALAEEVIAGRLSATDQSAAKERAQEIWRTLNRQNDVEERQVE